MSRKHKHHQTTAFTPAELRPRIERARREGRFQQALELAKQLHKYEPTPEHLELLKEVYLGRARQLRAQGQPRDALTVLDVASHLEGTAPAWLEQLAEETALCGEIGRTLALIDKLPDPAANRILGYVADAAIQQETAGRAALPPALRDDFDRIVRAFGQVESGQDEAARETLQGIGLRSPFLEWKLLLRGLQAYWQNDDVRALENWQRLTPERLPARLAAPFRFHLDPIFRSAQPPATQAVLQKQSDRLQGSPLLTHLRTLQATMADKSKFATAFRQAEALLPSLRQEVPHLVPRLARCFYWTVLETGPDDMLRYQRVFGKPADDPNFHRLQALGYEKGDELEEAHLHWQQYEKEIAAHPENWPGEQAAHARALIWQRMGQNAASIPETRQGQRRRPFDLFGLNAPQRPLNPSAEKCLQKSLQLAPDLLETHEALIRYHREGKREAKAEKAANELLKHFPDDVPTLELLSDLRRKRGNHAEALELMEQALRGNALDRRLRRKVSEAHLLLARSHGEAGRFEEARQQFQAALDLSNGADGGLILAHWAACEFRSGDAVKGEELVRQALAQAPAAVGIAYLLLTEVVRLKLDRTLKKRFEEDLKQGLAEPAPAGAVFLARVLAELHTGGVKYIGQKGHEQKVKSYIHKTRDQDFSESQLEELCHNLLDLEDYPKARRFADMGGGRYPNNPVFPYLHALGWIHPLGRRVQPYQVVPLLQRARGLLQGQPPNERRDRMLEDIDKHLHELNPFDLDFLRSFFENLGGGPDEDFDDGDDEW